MAGGFPVGLQWAAGIDFVAASTTYGATLTASASANTKGSYTQLISSTAQSASWIEVTIKGATANSSVLIDIAVGAAGSEIVVIPNIVYITAATVQTRHFNVAVPCSVPAGSRIAARCQAITGSHTAIVAVRLFADVQGAHAPGATGYDAYNIATTGSVVTDSTDPGGSANTKGAYTQLTASTSRDYQGFFLSVGPNNLSTSSITLPKWALDIAVGAAGSEIVIMADQNLYSATTSSAVAPVLPGALGYYPIFIPKGSRVAARAQCSVTTATGRLLGIGFYGCPL